MSIRNWDAYYCNQHLTKEMSDNIFKRNLPSESLQPNSNARSVSTRFTMPITDCRNKSRVPIVKYKDYSDVSDIILFDSKGYHKSESFDHKLLDNVPSELNKMIAGNIQIEDISNFKNKNFIIDLSGSLEDANGKKDIKKIDKLLNLFVKI